MVTQLTHDVIILATVQGCHVVSKMYKLCENLAFTPLQFRSGCIQIETIGEEN